MTEPELIKQSERVNKANKIKNVLMRLNEAFGELQKEKIGAVVLDCGYSHLKIDNTLFLTDETLPKIRERLLQVLQTEIQKEIQIKEKELSDV